MEWARILAYITGTVDQELLLRNEYLVAENRILKAQLKTRLRLTDADRTTLAEIAHRLGRKALEDVANAARPDTILGWYRRLVARKFDGSQSRRYPGRPRIDDEIEQLVVRMAKENPDWGYDRIVGALANLRCRPGRAERGPVVAGRHRVRADFRSGEGVCFPKLAEKICKDIRHAVKPFVGGVGLGVCLSSPAPTAGRTGAQKAVAERKAKGLTWTFRFAS